MEGGRTEESAGGCVYFGVLDDRDFSGVVGDSAISGFFCSCWFYGINPEVNLVRVVC